MNQPDLLAAISSIMYGNGEPMAGCQLSVEEAKVWVRKVYSEMPYCLVDNWRWLDIEVTEQERQILAGRHQQPTMIYSDSVIYDSNHRFPPGGWVRSTMLSRFSEGCLFQTYNTIYILMGDGIRLTTTRHVVNAIR